MIDEKVLKAIKKWANKIVNGIWTYGTQIVDERHGTHASQVIHLSLVLASLIVARSKTS